MRVLKLGILSFIFLFIVITIFSLFIPSHIRISKAINIATGQKDVLDKVRDPLAWRAWYPGLDSAKGYYENGLLKGMTTDEGGQAYLALTEDRADEVKAEFVTRKMRPVVNGWKIIHYSNSDSVTLQWYMDFHLRWYPWEKFGSLLLEKSYGLKMEQGLTNFKNLIEGRRTSQN